MKSKSPQAPTGNNRQSEFLILADGTVLAHNLTPMMARLLAELMPGDDTMNRRAHAKQTFKT